MSLETALQNARTLVSRFDKVDLQIQHLTLIDLGSNGVESLGGYIATFHDGEFISAVLEAKNWQALLDNTSRTAKHSDAEMAIKEAIAKTEKELQEYVKKHFRYSNPLDVPNEYAQSLR